MSADSFRHRTQNLYKKTFEFSSERFLIYNFDLKKAIRVALDDKSKFDYQVVSSAEFSFHNYDFGIQIN